MVCPLPPLKVVITSFRGGAPLEESIIHAYKKKITRRCWKCHRDMYWQFHQCKNMPCPYYYGLPGAIEHGKERFKRRMWLRAVECKGKLHPAIEKSLKDRKFDEDKAV